MLFAIHYKAEYHYNILYLQCKDDCITAENFQCYDYPSCDGNLQSGYDRG